MKSHMRKIFTLLHCHTWISGSLMTQKKITSSIALQPKDMTKHALFNYPHTHESSTHETHAFNARLRGVLIYLQMLPDIQVDTQN